VLERRKMRRSRAGGADTKRIKSATVRVRIRQKASDPDDRSTFATALGGQGKRTGWNLEMGSFLPDCNENRLCVRHRKKGPVKAGENS